MCDPISGKKKGRRITRKNSRRNPSSSQVSPHQQPHDTMSGSHMVPHQRPHGAIAKKASKLREKQSEKPTSKPAIATSATYRHDTTPCRVPAWRHISPHRCHISAHKAPRRRPRDCHVATCSATWPVTCACTPRTAPAALLLSKFF